MKKTIISLIVAWLLATSFTTATYADDDRYDYDDDRYEYDNKYAVIIPDSIKAFVKDKYNSYIVKAEKESYGYEVKLANGMELKFDNQWKLLYTKNYNYTQTNTTTTQQTTQTQYKYLSTSVKQKLDEIIKVKLFDRIKTMSTDKQIIVLDTLIKKIDDLEAKIKSQNNLTTQDYLKLEILEYLKEQTNNYLLNLQDPTTDVINSIFGE